MSDKPATAKGIDSVVYYVSRSLEFFSLGAWINIAFAKNEVKRKIAVDVYVLSKCAVAAVFLFTKIGTSESFFLKLTIVAIAVYAIIETLVSLFVKIFYPRTIGSINYRRATFLLLFNWLEIIIWYAILYVISNSIVFTEQSPKMFDYFYFSFLHGATMDMEGASVKGIGRIISMSQVTTFVIFITLFISHNFGKI